MQESGRDLAKDCCLYGEPSGGESQCIILVERRVRSCNTKEMWLKAAESPTTLMTGQLCAADPVAVTYIELQQIEGLMLSITKHRSKAIHNQFK